MNSLLLSTGARLITALLVVFSAHMLLRGHNQPGGGFIGGLIAASGFVIQCFASGIGSARSMLRVDPRNIGVLGLALALVSGLAAAAAGKQPFAGLWLSVPNLPLSTVLLFDVGVYLAVFGAILTLVFVLEDLR